MAKDDGVSVLSGAWINERIRNVQKRVEELIDVLYVSGLFSSEYLPMETPLTAELALKLTPDQFRMLLDATPSLEAKGRLKELLYKAGVPRSIIT